MKRLITRLLQSTVLKINGKCQHQSILLPMECVDLPTLKSWILEVRCYHKQPPWRIRIHTCAGQVLKQHTCGQQAHKVLHLPWCYSLLCAHLADCNVWLALFTGKSPVTSSLIKLRFPISSVCRMSQTTKDKLHLPVGDTCQMSQQNKWTHIQVDCGFIQHYQIQLQQD